MLKIPKSMFVEGLKYKLSKEAAEALYSWAETWEDDNGYQEFNPEEIYETWLEFESLGEAAEYFNIPEPPRHLWKCVDAQDDWIREEVEAVGEVIDFGLSQVLIKKDVRRW